MTRHRSIPCYTLLLLALISPVSLHAQYFATLQQSIAHPSGIAADSWGSLYVADSSNQRIVQLSAEGSVQATYVTSSSFQPFGVAVDDYGHVFSFDGQTSQILRWVNTSTSSPEAVIEVPVIPTGLAVDVDGYMYATDSLNDRVVKLNVSGQLLLSFDTSNPSLNEPRGIAVDVAAGNVFVADFVNNRVVQWSPLGQLMRVFESGQPALSGPTAVGLDGNGSVFVTDAYSRVVQYDSNANVTNTLTSQSRSIAQLRGVVVDAFGAVVVVDYGSSHVLRWDLGAQEPVALITSSPAFNSPAGVAVDTAGYLYIANAGNSRLLQIDSGGALVGSFNVTVVHSNASVLAQPQSIAVDGFGFIYVSIVEPEQAVLKIASDGTTVMAFTTSSPSLNAPAGVTLDGSDNLLVADSGNDRIVRWNSAGEVMQVINVSAATLGQPVAVAVNSLSEVYVGYSSGQVRLIGANSSALLALTDGSYEANGAAGLAVDEINTLWVADTFHQRLWMTEVNSLSLTAYLSLSASGFQPSGVAVSGNGNVYVTSQLTNSLAILSPCTEGQYCPSDSLQAQVCPAGAFCPSRSSSPTLCPAGTYSGSTGQSDSSACIVCAYETYCPAGTATPISCQLDNPGPNSADQCARVVTSAPVWFYVVMPLLILTIVAVIGRAAMRCRQAKSDRAVASSPALFRSV